MIPILIMTFLYSGIFFWASYMIKEDRVLWGIYFYGAILVMLTGTILSYLLL